MAGAIGRSGSVTTMRTAGAPIAPTVLSALVGAALVVSLTGCGGGGEDETPTGTATGSDATEQTSDAATGDPTDEVTEEDPTDGASEIPTDGTTESPGLEDVPTAEVGDCLNLVELAGADGVSELPTVDCAVEHDAQVFALVTLPDGDYPGEDALLTSVTELCSEQFEAFVGTAPEDSALALDGIGPSPESWAVGDREIVCLAFYEDLSSTTESFEGSGL
jgi:hypothetical protein